MSDQEKAVVDAVLYAMRCGCFFPVPTPTPPYSVEQLTKWGAMRNLHDKVAELNRPVATEAQPTELSESGLRYLSRAFGTFQYAGKCREDARQFGIESDSYREAWAMWIREQNRLSHLLFTFAGDLIELAKIGRTVTAAAAAHDE